MIDVDKIVNQAQIQMYLTAQNGKHCCEKSLSCFKIFMSITFINAKFIVDCHNLGIFQISLFIRKSTKFFITVAVVRQRPLVGMCSSIQVVVENASYEIRTVIVRLQMSTQRLLSSIYSTQHQLEFLNFDIDTAMNKQQIIGEGEKAIVVGAFSKYCLSIQYC